MKRLAVLVFLIMISCLPVAAHAHYYEECSPVVSAAGGGGGGGAAPIWLALGFTSFAAFVVYADAEGIDFPLCGQDWLNHPEVLGMFGTQCYGIYPVDRNGIY